MQQDYSTHITKNALRKIMKDTEERDFDVQINILGSYHTDMVWVSDYGYRIIELTYTI